MTTYYVSTEGSDSNNGLGPDASHATNKPWRTITYALGSSSGFSSGDTLYIGPCVFRETVAIYFGPSSESFITGDPLNAQGFKTTGGVLLPPAIPTITAYTTNDKTAPSSSMAFLTANAYLTVRNLLIIGGGATALYLTGHDYKFYNVTILIAKTQATVNLTTAADIAFNALFDGCTFLNFCGTQPIITTYTKHVSASIDSNIEFRNCLIATNAAYAYRTATSGAGTYAAGGARFRNCTVLAGANAFYAPTGVSTAYPIDVKNCVVFGALNATTSGQIVEDYNVVTGNYTNVTQGANTIANGSYAPLLWFGQERLLGIGPKPFLSPMPASPMLGFGNATGFPTEDIFGRPRPSGSGLVQANVLPGLGCYELHDFGAEETTVIDGSIGSSLKLTGPGDHEIRVAVDASSTTLSIKARYDSNHGTTNKPQAILLAQPELGVTGETKTMTAAADTWETLTFTGFTPTRKGIVRLRLVSRAAAGTGIAYFDTLAKS